MFTKLLVVVFSLHAHAPRIYNRACPVRIINTIIIMMQLYTILPYHLFRKMNHVVNLWWYATYVTAGEHMMVITYQSFQVSSLCTCHFPGCAELEYVDVKQKTFPKLITKRYQIAYHQWQIGSQNPHLCSCELSQLFFSIVTLVQFDYLIAEEIHLK